MQKWRYSLEVQHDEMCCQTKEHHCPERFSLLAKEAAVESH